jgi:putative flippase GtrA
MSYEDRVTMEKQEMEFVVATFVHHPVAQTVASLKDWGEQLVEFYVDDPLRRPMAFFVHKYWGKTNLVGLMRGVGECGVYGELCEPKVKIDDLEALDTPIVILSMLGLIVAMCQRSTLLGAFKRREFRWEEPMHRAAAVSLFVAAAVILNAGICGMIAGPFARYQARVIWLIPADALLMGLAFVPAAAWAKLKTRAGLDNLDVLWDRRQPVLARLRELKDTLLKRLDPEFVRFVVVGGLGFVMDTVGLQIFLRLGLGYYTGRIPSFLIACAVTWVINRLWTFKSGRQTSKTRSAALYLGVQCVGWGANLVVYGLCLLVFPWLKQWPLIMLPLILGAGTGMVVNFLGSKHLAFRARTPLPAKNGPCADTPAA